MDRIIVTGMRFYGYHGVMPEETKLGQHFRVDVEIYADLRQAGATDDLRATIHYGEVYNAVKQVAEGPPFKLVEAVAERVAARILAEFPAREVIVRVHKPGAPIPGPFECVTVEVHRRREL